MTKSKLLPVRVATLIRSLIEGGEANYADFGKSNYKLVEQLIDDEGVLHYRHIGTQQKKVSCPDPVRMFNFLENRYGITSLDHYIAVRKSKDEYRRSDGVSAGSDSKLKKAKVYRGFLINCYEPLECELDALPYLLTPVKGAFTFISDYKTFRIPPDKTVVIVEGHQNFRDIDQQRCLFESLNPVFIWRYQNTKVIRSWLNSIPNQYIHFGDFDLKGIQIFLSEFRNEIPGDRGTFFVPDNIEHLILKSGKRKLYDDQVKYKAGIEEQIQIDDRLRDLFNLIVKHKKGLEQEVLIKKAVADG